MHANLFSDVYADVSDVVLVCTSMFSSYEYLANNRLQFCDAGFIHN